MPAAAPKHRPRFLRIDQDAVDSQTLILSRQIRQLQQRLDTLRAERSADSTEATRLKDLIASREQHLVSLDRMRHRAGLR